MTKTTPSARCIRTCPVSVVTNRTIRRLLFSFGILYINDPSSDENRAAMLGTPRYPQTIDTTFFAAPKPKVYVAFARQLSQFVQCM